MNTIEKSQKEENLSKLNIDLREACLKVKNQIVTN